ncbi:MAG: hypothetical protein IJU86_00855 [Firmicutes bacterium]|nr:hypothetical protein [Bacillota bacterium]
MNKSNENTEIKQPITVLVMSEEENFTLTLEPNSTLKDLLLLIEAKKSFIYDYKSVTFEICKISKVVTKSDLNFRLEELGIKNNDAIKINISDKKLDNAIRFEDLENGIKTISWPWSRIILGVIDLLLLAAAITTFLLFFLTTLSFSVAVPIVLIGLFIVGAILFFGWKKVLPKILPKSWLKTINLGIKLNENDKARTDRKAEKNPEQYKVENKD